MLNLLAKVTWMNHQTVPKTGQLTIFQDRPSALDRTGSPRGNIGLLPFPFLHGQMLKLAKVTKKMTMFRDQPFIPLGLQAPSLFLQQGNTLTSMLTTKMKNQLNLKSRN